MMKRLRYLWWRLSGGRARLLQGMVTDRCGIAHRADVYLRYLSRARAAEAEVTRLETVVQQLRAQLDDAHAVTGQWASYCGTIEDRLQRAMDASDETLIRAEHQIRQLRAQLHDKQHPEAVSIFTSLASTLEIDPFATAEYPMVLEGISSPPAGDSLALQPPQRIRSITSKRVTPALKQMNQPRKLKAQGEVQEVQKV